MGKTISITIPIPLEEKLKNDSIKQGISRSRFICNILMNWSEVQKEKEVNSYRKENPDEMY